MRRRSAIRTTLYVALSLILPTAVLVTGPPAHAATPITTFTVDSEPGDYIGAGQTFTFTPSNSTITFAQPGSAVYIVASDGTHEFDARVAAPTGQTLTAGTTYPTDDTGDASHAQLDVGGDGRGCTSTGTVDILEYVVDGTNTVTSFAATYVQRCYGATQALYGELRYNSSIDLKADTVSPGKIDFGTQSAGTSVPYPVTISNTGTQPLSLGTATFGGPAGGAFFVQSDACSNTSVTVGSSCTLYVVFSSTADLTAIAKLTLSADTARGTILVSLAGTVVGLPRLLTLRASTSRADYNARVTLTAHLTVHNASLTQHIDFYATPYGDAQARVGGGNVNASGNVVIHVRVKKLTTFIAQFFGDTSNDPSSSTTLNVRVRPVVTGRLVGFYRTSGQYRLYHYSAACPGPHRGCPRINVSVTPNHGNQNVSAVLQANKGGGWYTVLAQTFPLNPNSKQAIIIFYSDARVKLLLLRVRVKFGGDVDHLAGNSTWSYFKVTS
jgi:hypothetical protein